MFKKMILSISAISVLILSGCTSNNQITMENFSQTAAPQPGETIAIIETTMGDIKVRLFDKHVPETVKNFTELAKAGKYENVPFHRVIKDFMIQTGDFENQNGTGGHSYQGVGTKFADEFSDDLVHLYGTLSMANAGPNTNGSQFFIVTLEEGTSWLDGKHSVFGQVYQGLEIAKEIESVDTDMSDRPLEPVLIKRIVITQS